MVMTELQEYIYLCEDIAKLKDIKYGQYTIDQLLEMLGDRFVELHYYLAAKANKWDCEIRFSDDADFIRAGQSARIALAKAVKEVHNA